MADFSIGEMQEMQRILQEKYKRRWKPVDAAAGGNKLRTHLVEEMADVLMYYNDVLLCCGISPDELKAAYTAKFEKNMTRW